MLYSHHTALLKELKYLYHSSLPLSEMLLCRGSTNTDTQSWSKYRKQETVTCSFLNRTSISYTYSKDQENIMFEKLEVCNSQKLERTFAKLHLLVTMQTMHLYHGVIPAMITCSGPAQNGLINMSSPSLPEPASAVTR